MLIIPKTMAYVGINLIAYYSLLRQTVKMETADMNTTLTHLLRYSSLAKSFDLRQMSAIVISQPCAEIEHTDF